eukprot:1150300-Pelagomonas_calceolata.AAC.4
MGVPDLQNLVTSAKSGSFSLPTKESHAQQPTAEHNLSLNLDLTRAAAAGHKQEPVEQPSEHPVLH